MPIENYREMFDEEDDYFTGFMSNEPIEGIDDEYIATTITEDDVLKISRQLDHSMGSYMNYFPGGMYHSFSGTYLPAY